MDAEGEEETQDITMGMIGSLEPSPGDVIAEPLLTELGSTRSFKREKRQAMRRMTGANESEVCIAAPRPDEFKGMKLTKKLVVSEIYSLPRITMERTC